MTREEAISWLVSLTEHEGEDIPIYDDDVEALNMAIEALEHPEKNVIAVVPCGDVVSRQAVIDLMMQKWGENFSGDDAMQECIDAIRVIPSVTPQEPVLDKIRAEIENINVWGMRYNPDTDKDIKPQIVQKVKEHVIEIIDKYKAEIEPQESEENDV